MLGSMSVYGEALLAYERGDLEAVLVLEREDGPFSEVPIADFFRGPNEWSVIDIEVLERCRGKVLDVGAGAGLQALWLQERGYVVTAIDVSAAAVDIMRRAGLSDARAIDVWDLEAEAFDTIALLGRNLGIAGDRAGLHRLLAHLKSLLVPGGQILVTSLDVTSGQQASHAPSERAAGEVRLRERFAGQVGPWVDWLYADPQSLAAAADKNGLDSETLLMLPDGNYAARLTISETPNKRIEQYARR
jgi:SAM-dependent methyltransferase